MKRIRYLVLGMLAGCSGSSPAPPVQPPVPPPPPVMNDSPGGVWSGTRPNGTGIIVLVSEDGDIRIIDAFGNQGFGQLDVTNQTDIAASYALAPPFGGSIVDGSDSGACDLTGTLAERLSMTYDVACTTSLGGAFGGTISLTYDPVYEMDSSIARIAGNWDMQGDVLTIDVNGALFMQSSQTGCVWNGQVTLLDTDWNLYAMSATAESCQGPSAPLSGTTWDGLVTILLAPGEPQLEALVGGLTADVDGLPASNVLGLPRI